MTRAEIRYLHPQYAARLAASQAIVWAAARTTDPDRLADSGEALNALVITAYQAIERGDRWRDLDADERTDVASALALAAPWLDAEDAWQASRRAWDGAIGAHWYNDPEPADWTPTE